MTIHATILFVLFSVLASGVEAACTGASPTWISTPDQASVQTCVNNTSLNDTVLVTAGTVTWSGTVTVPDSKFLIIQGAGIDLTSIKGNASPIINMGKGNRQITGFTFTIPAGGDAVRIDGDGWRVHHIKATSVDTSLVNGVQARGTRAGSPAGPTGLVDHVEFINARVLVEGHPDFPENSGSVWSSDLGLGDVSAVYVEDSTITRTIAAANRVDCNYGGRYVLRFVTGNGSSNIEAHSAQGGYRACRRWEVYHNNFGFTLPWFTTSFIRGGTGVIFENTIAAGYTNAGLIFDNRRSFESMPSMGQCDGTQPVDGNIIPNGLPGQGWPCRDQIGRGQDQWTWTTANPNPPQSSVPAYFWNNTNGGSPSVIIASTGTAPWIQANRDYYNHASPFDGTTGVGVGTLASRPPTCITGTAYWATDEGEWNSLQAGADGQLYKCTATNTWTLYYRPFPYPHPLQKVSGFASTPPPPQNVHVTKTN